MADLFSVRMRAAAGAAHEAGGRHLSGAEALVPRERVRAATRAMLGRALAAGVAAGVEADFVQVTVERVEADRVVGIASLPVVTARVADAAQARRLAVDLLAASGVAPAVAEAALDLLAGGPGPGGAVMRGAAVMEAASGRRLEPDPARGVRTSRVDLDPAARRRLLAALRRRGVEGRRPLEALVLASKGAWAGTLAEVCISDDPGYTTGFVASPRCGYVRLPFLKEAGSPLGGRVFFVNEDVAADMNGYVARLEEVPAMVTRVGPVAPEAAPAVILEGVRGHG